MLYDIDGSNNDLCDSLSVLRLVTEGNDVHREAVINIFARVIDLYS